MGRLIAQPGTIGTPRLESRRIKVPMGANSGFSDGLSTEPDRHYYAQRAEGGMATIVTEAITVSEGGRARNIGSWIYHGRFIPGLARPVQAIKARDCLTADQLDHRGALLRRLMLTMAPLWPSPWRNPKIGDEGRALDRAEIVPIQKEFVTAARRLWQAGYDAIELHAANGYLFHRFLTPRIHHRTDNHGGSIANSARLPLETAHRLKDALPSTPVRVRLSCTGYCEDGHSVSDLVGVAKLLGAAGVEALDLSGGTNESPCLSRFCIQPPSTPRCAEHGAQRPHRPADSPAGGRRRLPHQGVRAAPGRHATGIHCPRRAAIRRGRSGDRRHRPRSPRSAMPNRPGDVLSVLCDAPVTGLALGLPSESLPT